MRIILWIVIVVILGFFQCHSQLFPHIIWMYNAKGFKQMRRFQKICVEKVLSFHKNSTDWQVRFLQKNTLKKYMNATNYEIYQRIIGYNRQAIRSQPDLIKYFLLKQHGGVWIDLSVLLYENLNWLDHLQQNPNIIHRKIFKTPEIFQFSTYYANQKFNSQNKVLYYRGHKIHPILNLQNSFIAAVKQSRYINDLLLQMQAMIRDGLTRYNTIKDNFNFEYEYTQGSKASIASTIILFRQHEQLQISLSQGSSMQDNIDKIYKIFFMDKNKALFHIEQGEQFYRYLFEPENRPFDNKGMLLRKFTNFGQIQTIEEILDRNRTTTLKNQFSKNNHQLLMHYFTQEYRCLQQFVLRQQSLINKQLLFNSQLVKILFPNMQVTKQQDLPYICRFTNLIQINAVLPVLSQWSIYALILFFVTELSIQYFIFAVKNYKKYLIFSKQQTKRHIWRKLLILVTICAQKDMIQNQFTLWQLESPTALFNLIFICAWVFLLLNIILNNFSLPFQTIKNKKIEFYFCIVIMVQYFIEYNSTIWKYSGQVFNYPILQRQNLKTIQDGQNFAIKIILLVFLQEIFIRIKKLFNLKYFNSQKRIDEGVLTLQILIQQITTYIQCQFQFFKDKNDNTYNQNQHRQKQLQDNSNSNNNKPKSSKDIKIFKEPSPESQSLLKEQVQ